MNPDSLADAGFEWPAWEHVLRVVTLDDYNARVVTLGVALLGLAAGVIGSFLLLRRRALLGDAMSHAALPGIALAFMAMVAAGGAGKALPGLLLGALMACLAGAGIVLLLGRVTRIKEDAAIGIVLSVFFGLGVALLGLVQDMPQGNAAGLESFIYGKTASMIRADAYLIGGCAVFVLICCALFFKELRILCFDTGFTASLGWPVGLLDALLIMLVVLVTVVGLQAVGLILVIAFLITPAAAARFWTDRLAVMMALAGMIGAAGGALGAMISALVPRLPAGAVIVLACSLFFGLSMVFGLRRGLVMRLWHHLSLTARIGRQHLLRALYECQEKRGDSGAVSVEELLGRRSWTPRRLRRLIGRARRRELVQLEGDYLQFTPKGLSEARRIVRNHRLWEQFLLTHADVAPGLVDRDADRVEHVLGVDLVRALEEQLEIEGRMTVPPSPHRLQVNRG